MPSRTRMLKMAAQGDPILGLSFLAPLVGRAVGGLFKRGAKRVAGAIARRPVLPSRPIMFPSRTTQVARPGRFGRIARRGAGAVGAGVAFEAGGRLVRRPVQMVERPDGTFGPARRRRMNPLNVKALRRSTRRLAGFNRISKQVEKELRKLAPPARRRSAPSPMPKTVVRCD